MIGIYGIFKKHSNECYIGKSIKIESRFEEHKKHTHNERLRRNFEVHGIEAFEFKVIEECDNEVLNDREIFWIASYIDRGYDLYNATQGGDGGDTISLLSPERYAKFIEGRSHSRPEHSAYMKKCYEEGKPAPMAGKHHTPEAIEKIRQHSTEFNSFKGKQHSAETKSMLSEKASQRIWVNNDVIEKAIYTSELDSYILEGFHRGRLSRPRSKRKSQGATTIESVSRS